MQCLLCPRASSNLLEHTKVGSVLGYIKDVELRQSLDQPISALDDHSGK